MGVKLVEDPALRDRLAVFRDRPHAGAVLARLLSAHGLDERARVLAIPAGGVPVAAALADALGLPLDVVVVSKITLPWNTEVGYGAVAFDGSCLLNDALVRHVGLRSDEAEHGVEVTRAKVARRVRLLRGDEPLDVIGSTVIVVDDGLASGFTLRAALAALRRAGAAHVIVAVPTGPLDGAQRLAREVDALFVANLRSGSSFAVADAYERWSDVSEDEARELLARRGAQATRASAAPR
ncbi:MAG: phosphoribosyltransferase [Deltaproteobacteria bacterium]|nr:phosphoribosyltransferase [Deltaproteobacteria bacterium]